MSTDTIETPERRTAVVDGQIYDMDTGEFLGYVTKPEFHVTDVASAEWVMQKMHQAEHEVKGLQIQLASIQEQMETKIRRARGKVEWLQARFGVELEEFAKTQIEGAKTKTLKTPFGDLAFRTTPSRTKIREDVETRHSYAWPESKDDLPIIMWAAENCPEAIKVTEEFQISKVPAAVTIPDKFVEVTNPVEKFSVKVAGI